MSASSFAVATEKPAHPHPDRVDMEGHRQHLYLDPRVRKVQGFMLRNLHRKLSLHELAGVVAISSPRLSHLFKAQTGISPAQYMKFIRLQTAKDLLEGTHLSIKEVAGRVGLDPSRLSKSFREIYGLTPMQYRCMSFQSDLGARPDPSRESSTSHPARGGRAL